MPGVCVLEVWAIAAAAAAAAAAAVVIGAAAAATFVLFCGTNISRDDSCTSCFADLAAALPWARTCLRHALQ